MLLACLAETWLTSVHDESVPSIACWFEFSKSVSDIQFDPSLTRVGWYVHLTLRSCVRALSFSSDPSLMRAGCVNPEFYGLLISDMSCSNGAGLIFVPGLLLVAVSAPHLC